MIFKALIIKKQLSFEDKFCEEQSQSETPLLYVQTIMFASLRVYIPFFQAYVSTSGVIDILIDAYFLFFYKQC